MPGRNGKDALGYCRFGLSLQLAQRDKCPAQSRVRTLLALRPHGAASPQQSCPPVSPSSYAISWQLSLFLSRCGYLLPYWV